MTYRVTFVCTGNICRSPMAEHVLRGRLGREGLGARVEVDSSGTGGWHVGDPADHRTVRVLRRHGYTSGHRARRFKAEWFDSYDLVLALDTGQLQQLRRLARGPQDLAKLRLLRSFDQAAGTRLDVPDPYYGDDADFERVLELVEAAMPRLIRQIREALSEEPEDAEEADENSDEDAELGIDGESRTLSC
ncbi:MAG TPA: low molecular weight protein-tyrosine-phosphatase [Actinospica sp.]|jgi:protein-tyrosine phosphatase|nr:low molecular weight protein-tyrosine-phosphatase [Actinospica sp.]